MALLDALAARLGYVRQPDATKAAVQLPAWMGGADAMWDDASFEAREERQARLFARASWVNSAITFVAQQAASAALTVNRREGERLVAVENHPLELLLERPNPQDSRSQLMESTFAFLKLSGNAFWWLNRSGPQGPPAEIWTIPPSRIEAVSDGRLGLKGFLYDQGFGERIPLEPWEVVHFRSFNPLSQLRGLSPLESVEETAETDIAQRRWNRNYFAKENAKVPGALAFADPIDEARWVKLKAEVREQWGGVRRSGPVLLRNVGAGGVQWVQMGLSQADMEFLASRVANKEEIFSVFAPGLSSVLAVNATEANALAGRRTFIELAVWPLLVAVAEKLTNSLLPSFGPGLQAAFEDIRPTDRALQIAEQSAAERVLTIDELRNRFYELPSIGDERGRLLPAQVSPALSLGSGKPETPLTPASSVVLDGEELAVDPVYGDAQPMPQEAPAQAPPDELAAAAKAAELAQFRRWLKRKPGRDPAGFESRWLTEEEKAIFAKLDESELRPNEEMQAEARRGLEWRAEYNRGGTAVGVARARDIANNRSLSPDTWRRMASFFARHEVDKEAEGFRPGEPGYPSAGRIAWALWGGDAGWSRAKALVSRMDGEATKAEVAVELLPFGDGRATHKARYEAGADRERAALERKHADKLAEALRLWLRKALPNAAVEDADRKFVARLEENKGILRDAVYSLLWEAAMLGIEAADAQVQAATGTRKKAAEASEINGPAIDVNGDGTARLGASSAATEAVKVEAIVSTAWDMANETVIAWLLGATDYAGAVGFADVLANQLVRTTIEQARPLVAAWMGNGLPLEHLIGQLQAGAFSRSRAETIATTEVTRAYGEGNIAAWRASGTVDGKRWETVADEAVCPICGGLNGQVRALDEPFVWEGQEFNGPPAHPRCRCNPSPVINVPQAGTRQSNSQLLPYKPAEQVRRELEELYGERIDVVYAKRRELRDQWRGKAQRLSEANARWTGASRADQKRIQKEIDKIQSELIALEGGIAEVTQEYEQVIAPMRQLLMVKQPARIKTTHEAWVGDLTIEEKQKWDAGISAWSSLVDADAWPEALNGQGSIKGFTFGRDGRSYLTEKGTIHAELGVRTNAGIETIVHELGHYFEMSSDILAKSIAWRERRTAGEQYITMAEATGNPFYDPSELVKPDKFLTPYIGKKYVDNAGKEDGSEVMSMGLQLMHDSPLHLARQDPDMFDFVYNTARGIE